MPIPTPEPNEDQQAYISRVIAQEIRHGKPKDQAAAIAYSSWRKHKEKSYNYGPSASSFPRTMTFKVIP